MCESQRTESVLAIPFLQDPANKHKLQKHLAQSLENDVEKILSESYGNTAMYVLNKNSQNTLSD